MVICTLFINSTYILKAYGGGGIEKKIIVALNSEEETAIM